MKVKTGWAVWTLISFLLLALFALACTPAAPAPTPAPPPTAKPAATPAAEAKPLPTPTKPAPTPTPKPDTIKYGSTMGFTDQWPYYIAEAKGFFAEERLEPAATHFTSGDSIVQALIGRSMEVAGYTPNWLVLANIKGANLKVVYGLENLPVQSVMAASRVQSFDEFKGKGVRVAVSSIKSADAWIVSQVLKAKGLQEKVDFDLIGTGSSAERGAALKAGAVGLAIITPPFDLPLVAEGFKRLALSSEVVTKYLWMTVFVDENWAKANEDKLVRFLRAHVKATRWLLDPKNKAEAISILAKPMKIDEKTAEYLYESYIEKAKAFALDGAVDLEGFKILLDAMVASGDLDASLATPQKYLDLSYLEKAKK